MSLKVDYYVEKLQMLPHPEGGWYKETYRSELSISKECLGVFDGDRSSATGIYFLLTKENFSAFHRIKSDEMWHFYAGDGLVIHEISNSGNYTEHKLGLELDNGEHPQLVIAANSWFASEVQPDGNWCLVGCTVSPGFDFRDFELAERKSLIQEYPSQKDLINRLTRG